MALDNCENITVQGIQFEFSRSNGIFINSGNHNLIAGCTFRNLGSDAIVINGGSDNEVTNCDIHDVSMGGIQLRGGDWKKLIPANNFVEFFLKYGTTKETFPMLMYLLCPGFEYIIFDWPES